MNRWQQLRVWHRAGIVVACVHLLIYVSLFIVASGSMGIILLYYMEVPWMILIKWALANGTWSGSNMEIVVIGLAGTLVYGVLTGLVVLLFDRIKRWV